MAKLKIRAGQLIRVVDVDHPDPHLVRVIGIEARTNTIFVDTRLDFREGEVQVTRRKAPPGKS